MIRLRAPGPRPIRELAGAYVDKTFVAGDVLPASDLNIIRDDIRFLHDFNTVASATTISPTTSLAKVTGTTQIDNITSASHTHLVLWFSGVVTIRHNGGGTGNIRLKGGSDYTTTANDVIAFVYDSVGAVWYQQGASLASATLLAKTSAKDVASSGAETDLLNGEITIPGGLVGSTGRIFALLQGDYLYNRNVADTIAIRVSLGATDLFYSGTVAGALNLNTLSAQRRKWRMGLSFQMQGATNAVVLDGYIIANADATVPTTGLGGVVLGGGYSLNFGSNGPVTIDLTTSKALTVKVTWSTGSASNSFKLQGASVEVAKP